MKRILKAAAGVFLLSFMIVACEGSAGPQGPAGPAGPAGPDGPQGPAGEDANANCTQCHTQDTELLAKQLQFFSSKHWAGGNYNRGTRADCSVCHSHEGFTEVLATGEMEAAAGFTDPTPPNCRTCHNIHTTYTDADYGLTKTDAVAFWTGETVDFGNNANLCSQCHQSRLRDPMPAFGADPITFTSTHYGPHYAPQGNMAAGTGFFDFEGDNGGVATHIGLGCGNCHMAEGNGTTLGGHTFNVSYGDFGEEVDNTNGCMAAGCHGDVPDFGYLGLQTEIAGLLETLVADLQTLGIAGAIDPEHPDDCVHVVPGTYPGDVVAAFWNYDAICHEGSLGLHNPTYTRGLLNGSIDAIQAYLP
jgi:hypothetical protein